MDTPTKNYIEHLKELKTLAYNENNHYLVSKIDSQIKTTKHIFSLTN